MIRVLVTGAGGFIGTHIVRAGLARGMAMIAVTRHAQLSPMPNLETVATNLVDGDLRTLLAVLEPDVVINAASYGVGPDDRDPDRMLAVNTLAAHRLLAAAKAANVPRFIQLGSYSEYGDHPAAISEETPLAPKDSYGATKAAASVLIASDMAVPVDAIVLRLFNVWGPGERPHRLLVRVIQNCRAGTRLALTPGDQVKDWCYVGDVAEWILDVAQHHGAYPHKIVNLAGGQLWSVRDMATKTAQALNGEHLLDFGAVPVPAREAQTGPADLARVSAFLPHRKMTPLADAIAATIAATAL